MVFLLASKISVTYPGTVNSPRFYLPHQRLSFKKLNHALGKAVVNGASTATQKKSTTYIFNFSLPLIVIKKQFFALTGK